MGFFSGRVSFLRFRKDGPSPGIFGPEHLEKLASQAIGKQKVESKDGSHIGWIAGDDILDVGFDLTKNVVGDTLHFSLRVDSNKLPGDLMRAYTRSELQVVAANNPSGRPSAIQKKEAKEAARLRLEEEAKGGRFTRRKAYSLLWDGQVNQVLIGTTSAGALDHAQSLFQETFGCSLILMSSGQVALHHVEAGGQSGAVPDLHPTAFVAGSGTSEVAWVSDPASPTHLGNEFMLWLWFVLEEEGDTISLADGSDVAVMVVRTLALECPRGLSGSETIRSDGPTRLPEARRAIQAGKLPRQAGLILVRHDNQYELTLQAETLAVAGAKLPVAEEGEDRARQDERVSQLRHLIETIDLLYGAFLKRRLGAGWSKELERVQRWLHREERVRTADVA
jgi:hypothetical protein